MLIVLTIIAVTFASTTGFLAGFLAGSRHPKATLTSASQRASAVEPPCEPPCEPQFEPLLDTVLPALTPKHPAVALREELGVALDDLRPLIGEQLRFANLARQILECPDAELQSLVVPVRTLQTELQPVMVQRAIAAASRKNVDEIADLWRDRLRTTVDRPLMETPEQRDMRTIFFG